MTAIDEALRRTTGLSVLFSQAVTDRGGLPPTDLEALDVLARQGPMPAGRLAELTGLTTGSVTALVDRLERRGYARREPDPADRRRVIVTADLERAGRDLGPIYAAMAAAMGELLAEYGDEALAVILGVLRRAGDIVDEQIARVRAEGGGTTAINGPVGG